MRSSTGAAIDLSQFDSEYRRQTVRAESTPESIPDGPYDVRVESVELTKSKTSGQPMLKWMLRIQGPVHQGRVLWKNRVISQASLKWVNAELSICGLEAEPFSDLPKLLPALLGIELQVVKRTNNGFEDIYFNRRVKDQVDDDGLPF